MRASERSRYVFLSILIILASVLDVAPRAAAQSVTLNDSTVISNTARAGLNLIGPDGGYVKFKNYYQFGNPGFEPIQMKQVLQFQGTNSNSSPTSFQWDVNNTQYAGYDQNQWAGATFSVVQGCYSGQAGCSAGGTSDPAYGCTGTIASSSNVYPQDPLFTINPATNQGSNGCAGTLGLAGQVIIISTNNQMPNVFPTPGSEWTNGNAGTSFGMRLYGGATVSSETTDLCATCGQQSVLFTIPSGGSAYVYGGVALVQGYLDKTLDLNGTYTISFWAKSNAATPPTVAFNIIPRSGSACTQTFSSTSTQAITSTWKQFSFNCSFSESTTDSPVALQNTITISPVGSAATSLEFDNISMVNTADTNPTPYTDAYVNALKAWCQSTTNTTGPACTLRYSEHPDSETMTNWVKPIYAHQPSTESTSPISTGWFQERTNPNDFLTLCAYVGATPVMIFPSTFTPTDMQELVDFLEGPTSTTFGAIRASLGQVTPWVGASGSPFSTIYLEFGNENWNSGFIGHSWGWNSSAPFNGLLYDYAVRAGVLFPAARNYQTSQGYSQSATKWVFNLFPPTADGDIQELFPLAHPDAGEFNGYTADNINDTSTTGCLTPGSTNATCPLYGPTLTEPWSNTNDPQSKSSFYHAFYTLQTNNLCGPSGTGPCESMVYEENTGPGNPSTAGPFTQAVSDSFTQAAFQGVVTADQLGENDAAGIANQNYFTDLQYFYSNNGVDLHMWGVMIDAGGDCSLTNSAQFGGSFCPRPQMLGAMIYNWCKIGPMVQTSWTSNPTYNIGANNNSVHPINNVPVLRSFAFKQGDQRCMVIVNSDVYSSHQVTFSGSNSPTTDVTTYQFAPPALNTVNEVGALAATNTFQTPLSNTTTPGVDVTSGYALPPHSVTAFMWQTNGGGSTPTAATPSFSPGAGTYTSAQSVTISSSTPGATIYYTTNGSTPTTSSAVYSGAVTVSSNETLQAIAVESGYTNSSAASAAYVIAAPVPAPTFSIAGGTYSSAQIVSISDAAAGATIYYTTNGATPTASSTQYTGAITVSSTETIKAIAVGTGNASSPVATATYTINSVLPVPTFSVPAGTYTSAQTVALSDATSGVSIYYTTNGSTPTTSSTRYSGPITVSANETVEAIAVQTGYTNSPVAVATYTINTGAGSLAPIVNFPSGFGSASGEVVLNGTAQLNGSAVQLTGLNGFKAGSVWFAQPVDVLSFTTNFTFQLTDPSADGMTFTIQNNSTSALGEVGMNLGYGSIPKSVAVKFDLFNNAGEGTDSTGLYTNGATPTIPATDMSSSGVNLHSGDIMAVQLVYDGTTLTMTITDTVTNASFTKSWLIDIPSTVGGNSAYIGFTGGTGGETAIQNILSWTYIDPPAVVAAPTFSVAAGTYSSAESVAISDRTSGATIHYTTDGSTPTTSSSVYSAPITVNTTETLKAIAVKAAYTNSPVAVAAYTINKLTAVVNFPSGFGGSSGEVVLNGSAKLKGSAMQLTDANGFEAGAVWFAKPVNVQSFTTNFTFQLTDPSADGMTFAIQNNSTSALGEVGLNLGYSSIPKSVAVKFDLFNNAGEGVDSTGLYTNGATPTVPAVDLTPSGVNLHSGDTMAVQLVYDGTTLTITITDTVSKASFSKSWAINIPSTVGGDTAYVGFTGGTGGASAIQDILSWTYMN